MAGNAQRKTGNARRSSTAIRLWRYHRSRRRDVSKKDRAIHCSAHGHRPGERRYRQRQPQRRTGGLPAAGGDRLTGKGGFAGSDRPRHHDPCYHPRCAGQPFRRAHGADMSLLRLWRRRGTELRADGGSCIQPVAGHADRPLCRHESGRHLRAQRLGRRRNRDARGRLLRAGRLHDTWNDR